VKRIAFGVEYDGSQWRGWQTQPDGHTVQDRLEAALRGFAQREIDTTCAGRTDAGVHAIEQIVHFDTDLERSMFSWVRGVNAHMPRSIAVRWAAEIPPDGDELFHARHSARSRTYHYVIHNHPVRSPLLQGRAGWVFRPLDMEPMRIAAGYLLGEHDFSAFRASECQAKSPIKTLYEIGIERRGDLLVFSLRANAFLHHMVRNIVGSLILAGTGVRPPEWIVEILEGKDRRLAAPTFMPDGLYLVRIDYDEKWRLPQQKQPVFPWLAA
jgi:tRNA pseudouridine38-40 synthase